MDPRPFTLRALDLMADSCQRDAWNRTALVCSILANSNRDSKRHPKPFELRDFHPILRQEKPKPKSAAALFAVLDSIDGIKAETTTENTVWAVK